MNTATKRCAYMIAWIYDRGWSDIVYYCFHALGFLSIAIFNAWYARKYDIPRWKALLLTLVVYGIAYIWIYILCWAETGFKDFGGNNIVRGFVYFPLIAWPVSKLMRLDWKKVCDFIAPCICLCHGISHLGCIFGGCCRGFETSWGIYNPAYQRIVFPSPIFESLTALAIVLIVVSRATKYDYRVDGLAYPIMLIWFGFTRFFWEFFRVNKIIFFGCSSLALHALFAGIVGIVLICALGKHGNHRRYIK